MKAKSMLDVTLARGLSLMRPHGGENVAYFVDWLANALPDELIEFAHIDGAGNLHIDNRTRPHHKTLFVAHVDTVHRADGANKIRKTKAMWYADGAPLGADDGAGVALLMHLIHANVAGYYIFTQGEEVGGVGSKFLAKNNPELLGEFDRAIAFDRRGIDSVITHQGWGRCCSDEFAQALSDALGDTNDALMYLPDSTGVYTDTAEFVDDIPECTNISVGYYSEHGDKECLDMVHYQHLANAVVLIDWDGLPTQRDPSIVEPIDYGYGKTTFDWASYGVGSTRFYDDYAWTEQDVHWALEDAQRGFVDDLLELVAESVYPEDPELALRHLDPKRLTDGLCAEFKQMAKTYDAPTVLATVFDALYQE